jgi:hypothetical protein
MIMRVSKRGRALFRADRRGWGAGLGADTPPLAEIAGCSLEACSLTGGADATDDVAVTPSPRATTPTVAVVPRHANATIQAVT